MLGRRYLWTSDESRDPLPGKQVCLFAFAEVLLFRQPMCPSGTFSCPRLGDMRLELWRFGGASGNTFRIEGLVVILHSSVWGKQTLLPPAFYLQPSTIFLLHPSDSHHSTPLHFPVLDHETCLHHHNHVLIAEYTTTPSSSSPPLFQASFKILLCSPGSSMVRSPSRSRCFDVLTMSFASFSWGLMVLWGRFRCSLLWRSDFTLLSSTAYPSLLIR